jgi:acyl-CoA dehydrogenase
MKVDMSEEFHQTANRLFGDVVTADLQVTAEAGKFPQRLWDGMNALGLGLALVPEAQGGIGAGLPEAAAIARAAGEHAAPGPVVEWMLGNAMLTHVGESPAHGPLALVFLPDSSEVADLRNVPWLAQAQQLLAVGANSLALPPLQQLALREEGADASGEPLGRVELSGLMEWKTLGRGGGEAWLRRAALLRGAQILGAMQWCLARTTAYTQERKQFGREIGKFQVVQQMMAEMASAVVASQVMLDAAIAQPDNVAVVAAARSRLGDAADIVFSHAHQVHGAIGFSHEYALHFRTRRLMAWRDQFGTVAYWRRQLAAQFAGCDTDGVWPIIAG